MKLGEIITHRKGFITIDDSQVYKLCRVQLHRKGVVLREATLGEKIKTKKQQVCKRGDFIVAEMDAKVGGYGFIPDDLEGAIVSSHYFLFELNEEKVDRGYFAILVKFGFFQSQIKAVGSTNYAAVRPSDVLNWEVPVPSLKEQEQIKNRIEAVALDKDILVLEMDTQLSLLTALRQAILTEAVQGKLTAQWRRDNPNQEPAGELLKRIAAEKARLLKEKKISKEKPLPPIKAEDMPYEVPEGWVWGQIGYIALIKGGKRIPKGYKLQDDPTPYVYIRVTDMKNGTVSLDNLKYISQAVQNQIKNYTISKDDLYITIAGTIGEIGEIPNELDNMNLTENAAKIVFSGFSKHYLKIALNSSVAQSQFTKRTRQVAQPKLALKQIQNTSIPIPPLPEQHAIIQKVNTLLAYCDELEQRVRQSKADLDLLMQAVLGEVFGTEHQAPGSKATKTQLSAKETLMPNDLNQPIYEGNTLNMELLEIMQQQPSGKIAAVNLWKMSKYQKDIDAFYEALKREVEEKKTIKEAAEKGWLELVAS